MSLFSTVEKENRDDVDFRVADLAVGVLWLKLAIAKFALDFHQSALFEGSGPLAELPPDNTGVPFGASGVSTGFLVFPTDVGRN